MSAPEKVDVLAAIDRARDVLAEIYAKYQLKIGAFASQAQHSNSTLRIARNAIAELVESAKLIRDSYRSTLRVNCKCDEDFIDKQTAALDAALARISGDV